MLSGIRACYFETGGNLDRVIGVIFIVTDIASRAHIDLLMRSFYGKAMSDPLIGYLFTDVAKLDLDHHLPVIGDFWESTLFGTGVYSRHRRNPLMVHAELDAKEKFRREHFDRWLELFNASVDESFRGERAAFAKHRAYAIAQRFQQYLGTAG
jgi:hemoglobin